MNTQIGTPLDQETVSALMDGQLRGADLSTALRGMETADARQSWLVYHLVGDVLRFPDLAHGRHDLEFAERVRQRLDAQSWPAEQLAPAPMAAQDIRRPAANDSVFRWKMVAGLALLAAVAAIGWGALGSVGTMSVGPQLAQAPDVRAAGSATQVALLPVAPPVSVASMTMPPADSESVMLRDPRLDELLAAHRAATGVSALDNAAGFLRNATFQGEER